MKIVGDDQGVDTLDSTSLNICVLHKKGLKNGASGEHLRAIICTIGINDAIGKISIFDGCFWEDCAAFFRFYIGITDMQFFEVCEMLK